MFKTSFSDATSRYCLDVSLFMCCERQLVCELPEQLLRSSTTTTGANGRRSN